MATVLTGRYRLGTLIGRGGMGEVREGTDEALGRPVAIKLMRPDLADDAAMRHRFEQEARAAARISHPNVIAIYDVGEDDGVPFIVMERLSGRTLAHELADGPLREARVRVIAEELLAGLAAAHDLGVLHRDIKPGNVLLRDDHLAIADFGIAKIADDTTHATTGIVLGTAHYLAPERLLGEPATPASDVYSVGLVLFEALTGRPAFTAQAPLALAAAIASERPSFTVSERRRFDPGLLAVIDRAIAKDPRERFASAGAMRIALDGASAPDAVPTLPVRTTTGQGAPASPVVTSATERLPFEHGRVPPAARARRRVRRYLLGAVAVVVIVAASAAVAASTRTTDPGKAPPTAVTTAPAASGSVPGPLQNAIDRLDRAVGR